jgi:hypothetical protein
MILPNVAGREEVIERAIKNLKEKFGTEMTQEEMNEMYDITAKYIKHKLKTENICTVQFNNLGRAYYTQSACRKRRGQTVGEQKELWNERVEIIEDYFQSNQVNKNRTRRFKIWHVIKGMRAKNKTKGFDIFDIEESQNSDY